METVDVESSCATVQGRPTTAPGEGVVDDRPLWPLWETAKEAWLESNMRSLSATMPRSRCDIYRVVRREKDTYRR
jgi:hypothetical protein